MKNLKIYFTSDMHGFVYPTDYRDNEKKAIGMLNLVNSFEKDDNTLIIDGGDTIQGSPFTTYLSTLDFSSHPIAKVLNMCNYDYITLGNHDFNYGFDYLKSYLTNLNAKCLCTNVIDKTNTLPILKYDIKTMGNGLQVGILGLTTDFINVWEKPKNLVNFEVNDTITSCKEIFAEVKSNCDILIGIYHGGFENDLESHESLSITKENVAYKLCNDFDFDVLLTGHQHMPISGQYLHNTFIVQTPHNAQKYSEVNISFDDKIVDITSDLITPEINPNKEMSNKLMEYESEVQKWLDSPVGHLDTPLTPGTHIEMALNGSTLANFINTIQLEVSGADIACTSFANSIKGFNKDVTVRDIVSTYIFPNTLLVLEITGEVLKKALNRCAEYFYYDGNTTVVSDAFLKPKVEHYNYDFFSHIDYCFKLNSNGKNKVEYVKFNGKDVNDTDKFSIVMNNYRASGTGGYEFFKDCKILKEIQTEMTELIINYFREHNTVVVDKTKYVNTIM
ncbi:MAG: bifunctional metallophosphatase/5'-nucleotidase [Clostridium sp.]